MCQSNSPMNLWCYCIEQRAKIHNAIPRSLFQAQDRSTNVCTFGVQGDISNICNFGWYEWVYYPESGSFPENKEKLGRILGSTVNEGNEMAQAVLVASSKVITVERYKYYRLPSKNLRSRKESVPSSMI